MALIKHGLVHGLGHVHGAENGVPVGDLAQVHDRVPWSFELLDSIRSRV